MNTYGIDPDVLAAAFRAHTSGQGKFTRRHAITIADMFGINPMQAVWACESAGLCKRGSYEWFRKNGGITKHHVAEVRADREAEARSR